MGSLFTNAEKQMADMLASGRLCDKCHNQKASIILKVERGRVVYAVCQVDGACWTRRIRPERFFGWYAW